MKVMKAIDFLRENNLYFQVITPLLVYFGQSKPTKEEIFEMPASYFQGRTHNFLFFYNIFIF